jgi:hypothetical protein
MIDSSLGNYHVRGESSCVQRLRLQSVPSCLVGNVTSQGQREPYPSTSLGTRLSACFLSVRLALLPVGFGGALVLNLSSRGCGI